MNSITENIKNAIDEKKLSYSELSKSTGIPKSTLQRYATGTTKKIPIIAINKIEAALGVKKGTLMGWDSSSVSQSNGTSSLFDTYDDIVPIKTKKIPLLGEIACGEPIVANREYEVYVDATINIHADYAVKARGDSMINARIFDGDIVFIREQPDVEDGEIAAVIIEDEITLKRVYKEENRLELKAENPRIKPLIYRGEELNHIRILGKAIAFQSDII